MIGSTLQAAERQHIPANERFHSPWPLDHQAPSAIEVCPGTGLVVHYLCANLNGGSFVSGQGSLELRKQALQHLRGRVESPSFEI